MLDMTEKRSILETAAIITTIFMAAWHLGGEVQANSGAISELRADVREMRGLLVTHIAGHSHAGGEVVAKAGGSETGTQ